MDTVCDNLSSDRKYSSTFQMNLKDPGNEDEAYRLTFDGIPVYTGTGLLCQTTSDYTDTPTTGFTNFPVLIGTVSNAPGGGQKECVLATIENGSTIQRQHHFIPLVKTLGIYAL